MGNVILINIYRLKLEIKLLTVVFFHYSALSMDKFVKGLPVPGKQQHVYIRQKQIETIVISDAAVYTGCDATVN